MYRPAYLNTTLVSVREKYYLQWYKYFYKFKYNPCVGSSNAAIIENQIIVKFKYNPCVGSRQLWKFLLDALGLFKYNPCVGSSFHLMF